MDQEQQKTEKKLRDYQYRQDISSREKIELERQNRDLKIKNDEMKSVITKLGNKQRVE